jgi:hypothetical protein
LRSLNATRDRTPGVLSTASDEWDRALETQLNKRAYVLFVLAPEEIRIIEDSTKYHYGEV